MLVGEPDESKKQLLSLMGLHGLVEHLFLKAVGLAQLAFHPVLVYRMLEMSLGHTHQQPHRRLTLAARRETVDGTDGIDGDRLAASTEEGVYLLMARQTLSLAKSVG